MKQKPDWGFRLVLIPRRCEIQIWKARPRSDGSWELATGIVYKSGWCSKYAHCTTPPEKRTQHNVLSAQTLLKKPNVYSPLQIPPYRKKSGIKQEDPFFVRWRNGGLRQDGMVSANSHLLQRKKHPKDKGGSGLCILPWPLGHPSGFLLMFA